MQKERKPKDEDKPETGESGLLTTDTTAAAPGEGVQLGGGLPPVQGAVHLPPADRMVRPRSVWVKVVGQPISEDGECYVKGEKFPVTEERLEALGDLVEEIED